MTALQLRALRIIQQQPGLTAQDLAFELGTTPRRRAGIRWPQAATRWGSQYANRLARAGMITIAPHHPGWGKLTITRAGLEAIA